MSLENCRPKRARQHDQVGARPRLARALFTCGVAYSLLYAIENDVVAAGRNAGNRRMSQAISELSAKGSEARPFLTATVPPSSALMIALGIGVLRSAEGK